MYHFLQLLVLVLVITSFVFVSGNINGDKNGDQTNNVDVDIINVNNNNDTMINNVNKLLISSFHSKSQPLPQLPPGWPTFPPGIEYNFDQNEIDALPDHFIVTLLKVNMILAQYGIQGLTEAQLRNMASSPSTAFGGMLSVLNTWKNTISTAPLCPVNQATGRLYSYGTPECPARAPTATYYLDMSSSLLLSTINLSLLLRDLYPIMQLMSVFPFVVADGFIEFYMTSSIEIQWFLEYELVVSTYVERKLGLLHLLVKNNYPNYLAIIKHYSNQYVRRIASSIKNVTSVMDRITNDNIDMLASLSVTAMDQLNSAFIDTMKSQINQAGSRYQRISTAAQTIGDRFKQNVVPEVKTVLRTTLIPSIRPWMSWSTGWIDTVIDNGIDQSNDLLIDAWNQVVTGLDDIVQQEASLVGSRWNRLSATSNSMFQHMPQRVYDSVLESVNTVANDLGPNIPGKVADSVHAWITWTVGVMDRLVDNGMDISGPILITAWNKALTILDEILQQESALIGTRAKKVYTLLARLLNKLPLRAYESLRQSFMTVADELGPAVSWELVKQVLMFTDQQSKEFIDWFVPKISSVQSVLNNGLLVIAPAADLILNDVWRIELELWDSIKEGAISTEAVNSVLDILDNAAYGSWNVTATIAMDIATTLAEQTEHRVKVKIPTIMSRVSYAISNATDITYRMSKKLAPIAKTIATALGEAVKSSVSAQPILTLALDGMESLADIIEPVVENITITLGSDGFTSISSRLPRVKKSAALWFGLGKKGFKAFWDGSVKGFHANKQGFQTIALNIVSDITSVASDQGAPILNWWLDFGQKLATVANTNLAGVTNDLFAFIETSDTGVASLLKATAMGIDMSKRNIDYLYTYWNSNPDSVIDTATAYFTLLAMKSVVPRSFETHPDFPSVDTTRKMVLEQTGPFNPDIYSSQASYDKLIEYRTELVQASLRIATFGTHSAATIAGGGDGNYYAKKTFYMECVLLSFIALMFTIIAWLLYQLVHKTSIGSFSSSSSSTKTKAASSSFVPSKPPSNASLLNVQDDNNDNDSEMDNTSTTHYTVRQHAPYENERLLY